MSSASITGLITGRPGTKVRSYSKINLGLAIGPVRADGFHGLTTLYQTLALHDVVTVSARRAVETKIVLTTNHPYVPRDGRNTCWKMVERALLRLGVTAEVAIHIEKNLPVQGGMGAGSANAAAALIGLERELGVALKGVERLELAAGVGSDVPLFLLGGSVLGLGRGELVVPLPDMARVACVIAVPGIGVSTPAAFRDWDALVAADSMSQNGDVGHSGLTSLSAPDRLMELSLAYAACYVPQASPEHGTSGIVRSENPEKKQGSSDESQAGWLNDLAENTLLSLVRTGVENGGLQNDFEAVVFPSNPSLREIKRLLMGEDSGNPALYAALSGSGSALFGLYWSMAEAEAAQQRVQMSGVKALITETLPRTEYWARMFAG